MAIYEFEGKRPKWGKTSLIFPSADIIGDVVIGEECFIGAGVILRGDYGSIRIGDRTSVQENVVVHAREKSLTIVRSNVQLGHGCILHNCIIDNNAIIGISAIITDFSVVDDWAIIGEGAVVRGYIPAGKVALGIPAKIFRDVTSVEKEEWQYYKDLYVELASRYRRGLKKIK
ncbi:gamma carbonic anhydrase family protein [Candidatus Daviesbacteria bacterium]|nr:gamma carbonic anhydrase family protein [Candidatus Daviesbacteria bacterium]